jgi:hypothetical protein
MNTKHSYNLKRTGGVFGAVNFETKHDSQTTIFADNELGIGEISYDLIKKLKKILKLVLG